MSRKVGTQRAQSLLATLTNCHLGRMKAVLHQDDPEVGESRPVSDSQPQVAVLGIDHYLPITPNRPRKVSAHKHSRMPKRAIVNERGSDVAIFTRIRACSEGPPRRVDELNSPTKDPNLRMLFHELDLLGETVAHGNVVGIHSSDVFAQRQGTTAIQRFDEPSIFLMMDPHPSVAFLVSFEYQAGSVTRAVVYDDELKIGETLAEDTVHRFSEKLLSVEYAHHHRYQRN
jgi:hypothetical protein